MRSADAAGSGRLPNPILDAYEPGTVKYFARRQRMAAYGDGAPVLPAPPRGASCNRCGMCCVIKPCWVGRMLFEIEEGECPALQWSAGGSSCGLMAAPGAFTPVRVRIEGASRVREAAKTLIGAGVGCVSGREARERRNKSREPAALKTLGLVKAWKDGKS